MMSTVRVTDLVIWPILIQASAKHQAVEVGHAVAEFVEGAKLQRAVWTLQYMYVCLGSLPMICVACSYVTWAGLKHSLHVVSVSVWGTSRRTKYRSSSASASSESASDLLEAVSSVSFDDPDFTDILSLWNQEAALTWMEIKSFWAFAVLW